MENDVEKIVWEGVCGVSKRNLVISYLVAVVREFLL